MPFERTTRFWSDPPRAAYLLVTPWLLGLAFLLWTARRDAGVAARQRAAETTVVAHEPEHHDRYGYTFTADGRAYRGWDSPVNRAVRVGQRVTVYYDPADPNTNGLTGFAERRLEALGPAFALAFTTAGALLGIFVLRRRARLRPHHAPTRSVARQAQVGRQRGAA